LGDLGHRVQADVAAVRQLSRPIPFESAPGVEEDLPADFREANLEARALIVKANRLLPGANAEDASELKALLADREAALARRSVEDIRKILPEVEDLVFYLEEV
jgi:hypothetical protein